MKEDPYRNHPDHNPADPNNILDTLPQLLPCPFCGKKAKFDDDGEGGHFVACTNKLCMASSRLIVPTATDPLPLLAEAWNSRSGAEIDYLKTVLKHVKDYFQSPIPANKEQQEQSGEEFTNLWSEIEDALNP